MRRIQVKLWPEIDLQYPAIISLERIERNKRNPIDIDFSNAYSVSSSGLTILLVNLIKIAKDLANREWDIIKPRDKEIDAIINRLNFYTLLVTRVPNQSLFWYQQLNSKVNRTARPIENTDGIRRIAYPIYELDFNKSREDRRATVDAFKQFLISELFFLQENFYFDLSTFIQMLVEMAKNASDHTSSNAYFGLDILTYPKKIKLKFSFGDLGLGINQNIRQFIKYDKTYKEKDKHLALTDSYHWALQVGTTTKPDSGINKGIGMSTIFYLAKQLEANLSVFDATSRGLLSSAENITHVDLRKIFYSVDFKVGFYYYGETEINTL